MTGDRPRLRRNGERPILDHFLRDGFTPKKAFTKAEANVKVMELADADLDNGILMSSISSYECPTCKQWHVGNTWRDSPRNRRRLAEVGS